MICGTECAPTMSALRLLFEGAHVTVNVRTMEHMEPEYVMQRRWSGPQVPAVPSPGRAAVSGTWSPRPQGALYTRRSRPYLRSKGVAEGCLGGPVG